MVTKRKFLYRINKYEIVISKLTAVTCSVEKNLSVASEIFEHTVLIKTKTAIAKTPNSIQVNFSVSFGSFFPRKQKSKMILPRPKTGNAREAGDIDSKDSLLR